MATADCRTTSVRRRRSLRNDLKFGLLDRQRAARSRQDFLSVLGRSLTPSGVLILQGVVDQHEAAAPLKIDFGFSAVQAAEWGDCSVRTAERQLAVAATAGLVEVVREGSRALRRRRVYRLLLERPGVADPLGRPSHERQTVALRSPYGGRNTPPPSGDDHPHSPSTRPPVGGSLSPTREALRQSLVEAGLNAGGATATARRTCLSDRDIRALEPVLPELLAAIEARNPAGVLCARLTRPDLSSALREEVCRRLRRKGIRPPLPLPDAYRRWLRTYEELLDRPEIDAAESEHEARIALIEELHHVHPDLATRLHDAAEMAAGEHSNNLIAGRLRAAAWRAQLREWGAGEHLSTREAVQ